MFKFISLLRFDKDIKSFIYKLIDTEFECEINCSSPFLDLAAPFILEYKKRNYSHDEIVKNLFKLNLYLCNKHKYSFEDILKWQNKYIDKSFSNIYFNEKYSQRINSMWDKYKSFI